MFVHAITLWRCGLGTCHLHTFCTSSWQSYCRNACLRGCGLVVAYLRCSNPAIEERHLSVQPRLELVTSRVRSTHFDHSTRPPDCSRAQWAETGIMCPQRSLHTSVLPTFLLSTAVQTDSRKETVPGFISSFSSVPTGRVRSNNFG
jgi:hypothetical protein